MIYSKVYVNGEEELLSTSRTWDELTSLLRVKAYSSSGEDLKIYPAGSEEDAYICRKYLQQKGIDHLRLVM